MRMVILCSWKSITVGVMLSQDPLCQFRDHGLNDDLEAPKGMDVYPLFFFLQLAFSIYNFCMIWCGTKIFITRPQIRIQIYQILEILYM